MEEKHYKTAGRTALIEYMKTTAEKAPQDAAEIFLALPADAEGKKPGRSSVYRLLSELAEEGVVRQYRKEPQSEGFVYQYAGEEHCEEHFHLQCVSCGKIEHLHCECGEELRTHLIESHGFVVDSGKTVLYGLCSVCAGRGAKHGNRA